MKLLYEHISQAFQALWKRRRERTVLLATGIGALGFSILLLGIYAAVQKQDMPPALAQTGGVQEISGGSAEFNTIHPTLVSDSSSIILLGSILSHETANIYPRRDGIVEDIYVDIGDTVRKNQVVALLLPKGVEGQSAAMIGEKQARKYQAESDLSTAETVARETVINAQQNILEKKTDLLIAQREQEMLLETIAESEANISQMREQAFTVVQNARQLAEWVLLGANSRTRNYIEEYEVLNNIGQLDTNTMSRVSVVEAFNDVLKSESAYGSASVNDTSDSIQTLLLQTQGMLSRMLSLLQSTSSSPSSKAVNHYSYDELNDRIAKVIAAQDAVFKAREKIDDAQNSFNTLVASEPEIAQAYRSSNAVGKKSNKVRTIESQIQTAYNVLALTEAHQEQTVERQRTQVGIADAILQSEYAESGHRQILSPFSGTVSKRFIDVGKIVMPSMSAFELTDVPTSLAKKAKSEVKFGLPEHLLSAIDIGDTVTFFLQTDETTAYTAEVTRKSPQVDLQTHTVTVQAKLADDVRLPHGTSVRIRITDEKNPVFSIPSSAVKRKDDRNYIWIVDPETKEPIELIVSVTAEDGEFAEITGSITKESAVILDPPVS